MRKLRLSNALIFKTKSSYENEIALGIEAISFCRRSKTKDKAESLARRETPKIYYQSYHYLPEICKNICIMAKGPEKNTKNKALHTKLLNRKKAKLQEEKKQRALRLKALVAKMNNEKSNEGENI